MIKIQRLASISCQTDQNNSKLQKRSNYNVLHRIDVKTIKNVAFRRKTFERKLNYKSNQITTICIDLMSKRSKRSKQRKITNAIKLQWICIDLTSNDQKCWIRRKTFKTTQNYKSNQIMTICIDLTSKRSKTLSYVAKHSKQRKTTKVIKIQLLASIRRRKDKKCRVISRKTFKTTNYKVIKL